MGPTSVSLQTLIGNIRLYLGGWDKRPSLGKLMPLKSAEVLRNLTRGFTQVMFVGSSLGGTWTGGGITISMSSSGRYMVRGASLVVGLRKWCSSNMDWNTRGVAVKGK